LNFFTFLYMFLKMCTDNNQNEFDSHTQTMFASKKNLIQYVEQAFQPIRLSAPLKEWKALQTYKTKIFTASFTFPHPLECYSNLDTYPHISFSFAKPHGTDQAHLFSMDANLLNMFGMPVEGGNRYEPRLSFTLPIYDFSDEKSIKEVSDDFIVTLDTKGMIPERWIKMLVDFSGLKQATLDYESKNSLLDVWKRRIENLDDVVFDGLVLNSLYAMSDTSIYLKVLQSPLYTKADWDTYVEPNRSLGDERELGRRIWITPDHHALSPGTRIFFKRCLRFQSFYPARTLCDDDNKQQTRKPEFLGGLSACEGGISLYYYYDQPWYNFLRHANWRSVRFEIKGNYSYSTYKGVSFEEIVLLAEALRVEGAHFVLSDKYER
jgi:hypothetical protein